jgi:hypothetical protein
MRCSSVEVVIDERLILLKGQNSFAGREKNCPDFQAILGRVLNAKSPNVHDGNNTASIVKYKRGLSR